MAILAVYSPGIIIRNRQPSTGRNMPEQDQFHTDCYANDQSVRVSDVGRVTQQENQQAGKPMPKWRLLKTAQELMCAVVVLL